MFAGKDFTPAQIQEVQTDSPAFVAGIKTGDIIHQLITIEVKSIMEVSLLLTPLIRNHKFRSFKK